MILYQGVQKLRLGSPDIGSIHQGNHFALSHSVADLLERPNHGARNAGRESGRASLVVGNLAIACDEFDHRGLPDRLDLDPGFLDGLLGRELDAALVALALAVVFGPLGKVQGTLRPCKILRGDVRGNRRLGDVGVIQRTVVNAVPLAPSVAFQPGHQVGIALDTLRLRYTVCGAPVVLAFGGLAHERGK